MSDTIRAALLFLITTVFDIYLYILMIRLILIWVGADYYNPFIQFIARCTDFIIKPMRRYLRNYKQIEVAGLFLLLVVQMIKFTLICIVSFGFPNIFGVFILAIADSIKILLGCFFYAILLQAIISWIQPGSPISLVLYQFTAPIMRPLQRIIPPVGGIDISPIPALLILQLLIIIIVGPMMSFGLQMAIG